MEKKKVNGKFRIDIVLIVSFFVLLVSFCAYMIETDLTDVLNEEYGSSVVTHDYTYDSESSK